MSDPRAVPLTVIGGFLGAGKTTLLNALLAQADGRRIAVLVNDFGDLQIDAALIARSSATTIALRNGCVCCSLAGGLVNALSESLAIDPRPDHVVVEASGVSDPRRIAQVARSGAGFSPEATLVVVAADQIETLARDRYVGDTVIAQLAAADLLILNKMDLVDEARKRQVREWLKPHAPRAALIEAQHANVPIEIMLGPMPRVNREDGAGPLARTAIATDVVCRFVTATLIARRKRKRPHCSLCYPRLPFCHTDRRDEAARSARPASARRPASEGFRASGFEP